MAYDKADWHSGGDFPEGLSPAHGGTHIGMFVGWAITRGLEGELHRIDSPEALAAVCARQLTGRQFLAEQCDERLTDEDLNSEANAFADAYYNAERGASYFDDYAETLASRLPTIYHVADTWANFDRLAEVLDRRLAEWRTAHR